jgi:GNAT superfamily N-acetyltransferase
VEIRRESYAGQTAQTLATALYDELLERYARWPGSGGEPPASAFEPPEGAFLVGWEGNEAVACGGVCHYEGTTGEIRRVYVAPAARSRALSREMLAALEEEARRLGYAFVRLETGGPPAGGDHPLHVIRLRPILRHGPYVDDERSVCSRSGSRRESRPARARRPPVSLCFTGTN